MRLRLTPRRRTTRRRQLATVEIAAPGGRREVVVAEREREPAVERAPGRRTGKRR